MPLSIETLIIIIVLSIIIFSIITLAITLIGNLKPPQKPLSCKTQSESLSILTSEILMERAKECWEIYVKNNFNEYCICYHLKADIVNLDLDEMNRLKENYKIYFEDLDITKNNFFIIYDNRLGEIQIISK